MTGVQQLLDASDADVSSNEASALLDRWRVLSGEKADSGLSEGKDTRPRFLQNRYFFVCDLFLYFSKMFFLLVQSAPS